MYPIEPPHVYIDDTHTPLGRGVFSARGFEKGETVEFCPVFLVEGPVNDLPQALRRRLFNWPVSPNLAVALGYGSLYNHNDLPNLRRRYDPETMTIEFIALRDIEPREQLTINYESNDGVTTNWFEGNGVKKLKV